MEYIKYILYFNKSLLTTSLHKPNSNKGYLFYSCISTTVCSTFMNYIVHNLYKQQLFYEFQLVEKPPDVCLLGSLVAG